MPRVRTKPINPFIAGLMAKNGITNLNDLPARFPGLGDVYHYADLEDSRVFRSLLRDAHALGLTVDDFLTGLLGIADEYPMDTQQAS